MYLITDASDERLISEADSIANARFAAKTHWAEGEDLPILISLDETVVERLIIDPQSGRPVFQGVQGRQLA